MDLLAAAAERQRTHGDLLNLVAGQPMTWRLPVRREAIRLLESGDPLGYTVATGIPEREAIAGHHLRVHGIEVSPDDVVVTTGSLWRLPAGLPGGVRGRRPRPWRGPATPATATC
ncbi:MAG: hypothetical protein R2731_09760 [Nocardioides sp.]